MLFGARARWRGACGWRSAGCGLAAKPSGVRVREQAGGRGAASREAGARLRGAFALASAPLDFFLEQVPASRGSASYLQWRRVEPTNRDCARSSAV